MQRYHDRGPIYWETLQHIKASKTGEAGLVVEPFNMVTAAVFVVIALFWLVSVGKRLRDHTFIAISVGLLLVPLRSLVELSI